MRLPEATCIQPDDAWVAVRHLRQRAGRMRVLRNVRRWKGAMRRSTVCLERSRTATGATTTWYSVTNLAGEQPRFVASAGRWWQACTHKLRKRALLDGARVRVTEPPRVAIVLMGFGGAGWALWLLGRAHARLPHRKPTTTRTQLRRQKVIKRGWDVLQAARKRRSMPALPPAPAPRVRTYQRRFPGFRLPCDAAWVELW